MSCICQEVQYAAFDSVAGAELKFPITANSIVNQSRCVIIHFELDDNIKEIALSDSDVLSPFKGKVGVYQLWVEQDSCADHDTHRLLCLYVGKGVANIRIKDHIKSQWPQTETLYASFYECENRLAKYIEQLFLDNYSFHLNENENKGQSHLHALWDDSRFVCGTEVHAHAEISAKKFPDIFNP